MKQQSIPDLSFARANPKTKSLSEWALAARNYYRSATVMLAAAFCLTLIITTTTISTKASAMKIQEVTSPGGISAWLVEEHSVPVIAVRFSFAGGSVQDPTGLAGVANFVSVMLDEGAGELSSSQFMERQEDLAMRMSFNDGRDRFYGSFETLAKNRDASFELLRLAVTKPRFDDQALERMRAQLLAGLAFRKRDPRSVAARSWGQMAFGKHPYGRPADGTEQSLAKIKAKDLEAFRARIFAKDKMRIVVVGDIDAQTLSGLLDKTFGALADNAQLVAIKHTEPTKGPQQKIITMKVPQSVAQFGMIGLARDDKDFLPAYVLNHIVGSGSFSSILMQEVREKRGLAYSVYSYLQPLEHAAVFAGSVATKNEAMAQSMDVIKAVLARIAKEGPSATELKNGKAYLTGSFALRFDTSAKIASQLLYILNEDLGIDYIHKRNDLLNAVTLKDVKRVAARLLKIDGLLVTIVGQPLEAKPKG